MKTYAEKLKDPRWQRKRLEIMARDNFCCSDCGNEDEMLNVHHRYYINGRNPWEYPNWALKTVCKTCHKSNHTMDESRDEGANIPLEDPFESVMIFLGAGNEYTESHIWDLGVEMSMLSAIIGREEAFGLVLNFLSNFRKEISK